MIVFFIWVNFRFSYARFIFWPTTKHLPLSLAFNYEAKNSQSKTHRGVLVVLFSLSWLFFFIRVILKFSYAGFILYSTAKRLPPTLACNYAANNSQLKTHRGVLMVSISLSWLFFILWVIFKFSYAGFILYSTANRLPSSLACNYAAKNSKSKKK